MSEISFWDAAFLWRDPLLAACLGAILCSLAGVFVVLKRAAFVGAAVSQASSMGVVLALLSAHVSGWELPPLASGILVGSLSAGLFGLSGKKSRVGIDSSIALAYVIAGAASLLLGTFLTHEYEQVHSLLFGDAVAAPVEELMALGLCVAGLSAFLLAFFPKLVFVSFDAETASAMGLHVSRYNAALYFLLGLSIAVSTRALGALTVFALTVIPASGGLLLFRGMRALIAWSLGASVVASVVGYYLSFVWSLPTGATIVGTLTATLCLALVLRPFRR